MTAIPPSILLLLGATARPVGLGSVITNVPETIDASAPRFTAMFLGPSAVEDEIEKFILALVEATDEIRPPNVGEPRTTPELEAAKETPGVMSSPPTVI